MAHQRQIIRDAVAAALVTGSTAAGTRVFPTRMGPLRTPELPALCVYTETETIDPISRTTSPRELQRELNVVIEGFVNMVDDVQNSVDDLAKQVERVMHADPQFGGLLVTGDSILVSTEFDFKDDGKTGYGAFRMTYEFTYRTLAPLEEDMAPLDDLNTIDAKWSLSNDQAPADQAEDVIDFT